VSYPHFELNRVKLAMRMGDKYRLGDIGLREWQKLSDDVSMEADEIVSKLVHMAQALPDLVTEIAHRATNAGLAGAVIDRLSTRLIGRSRICLGKLGVRQRS
jgi:serine/threonine-protein kinase HipA